MDRTVVDLRELTAHHEAAHAVVAVAVGVQVTEVSIRPRPGEGIMPFTLGHMRHWRHSDPRPEDCWSGSLWFESVAMTWLAGYVMEELLDPDWYFRYEEWDHHCVLDMIREFSARAPEKGVGLLAQLRDRSRRLLIRSEFMVEVTRAADLLLEKEEVGGTEFYEALYGGRCSATHPSLTEARCKKSPHPFGPHFTWLGARPSESEVIWDGLPLPPRNQKVGAMTPSQKRIRAINRGQAPRPLTKAWRDALDDYAWSLAGISWS